jgi:hypothetical protein
MLAALGATSFLLLAVPGALAQEGADPAMHQLPDDPQGVVVQWRSAGGPA